MSTDRDHILCTGLACEALVGLRDFEASNRQRIVVDFDAEVEPVASDDASSVRLDYAEAIPAVKALAESKHFRLIETLASEAAELLTGRYGALVAEVTVSKFPKDLPAIAQVSCRVLRTKGRAKPA